MKIQILVVEDDPILIHYVGSLLSKYGRVFKAHTMQLAQNILTEQEINLAFIDLNLSPSKERFEGLELIKTCSKYEIQSAILTSHSSPHVIEKAFQLGCHYYFSKENLEEHLEKSIEQIITSLGLKNRTKFFKKNYVTQNDKLKKDIEYFMNTYSNTKHNILITGPSGVGKTHLVSEVHRQGDTERPLISKNLNEISNNLFESELFGHKKGSFTGADNDKVGLLEMANGGTLFLDEIGVLPNRLQQKLLKVIDEKKFTPVGSTKEIHVEFKLVTATCDNLQEKIASGSFRLDFYFRINGSELNIPAINERRKDIELIIETYINQSSQKIFFDKDCRTLLMDYSWPGNVRELHSLLDKLLYTSMGTVTKDKLPIHIRENTTPGTETESQSLLTLKQRDIIHEFGLPELVKQIEIEAFKVSLIKLGDKVNKVADDLKISKSVYYRIAKELSIS
jgi:DNA-binding NtrC family response regulator